MANKKTSCGGGLFKYKRVGGSPSAEFITLINELSRWWGLLDSRFGQHQISKQGARSVLNSL